MADGLPAAADENASRDLWEKGLREFVGAFSFTRQETPDWRFVSVDVAAPMAQELGWRALVRGRVDAIAASTIDSWFRVRLNGVPMQLPRYTMMIMRNCINASADGTIDVQVETSHWERIRAEFGTDTLFLDIGAAAGTMTAPYAIIGTPDLRIVAFEPSRRARDYLESTLARNEVRASVIVKPYALSDEAGKFQFMELPEDETGNTPYLPEASRLQLPTESLYPNATSYDVEVRTLDSLAQELRFAEARKIVVKIDVEGFEDKVLTGALETLRAYQPFLSIDIHNHPGRTEMTDAACIALLEPLGYRFERMGHVLLARAR